jgi:hypothetical protein
MIRQAICLGALAALAIPHSAAAQSGSVAVSYGYMHQEDFSYPRGWLFAGTGNLTPHVALVGEVGGSYKHVGVEDFEVSLRDYSFLGGVRFQAPASPRIAIFGQVLAGTASFGVKAGGQSDSEFVWAVQPGGGLDVYVTRHVGIRTQADFRTNWDQGETANQFRFAIGGVYGFGR